MSNWDEDKVEFNKRCATATANAQLRMTELRMKMKNGPTDQNMYDWALGERTVYSNLHNGPALSSRDSLRAALESMRDHPAPVVIEAMSHQTFEEAFHFHVAFLLKELFGAN